MYEYLNFFKRVWIQVLHARVGIEPSKSSQRKVKNEQSKCTA